MRPLRAAALSWNRAHAKTADRSPQSHPEEDGGLTCFQSFRIAGIDVSLYEVSRVEVRLDLIQKVGEEISFWEYHKILAHALMVITRHHDDRHLRISLAELVGQFDAADARHAHVRY